MKCVAISDTHSNFPTIPDGDVFIHAGDATWSGTERELEVFSYWLQMLPHKHKIYVPGNHDRSMELDPHDHLFKDYGVHVLIDEAVIIEGIAFYGSPRTREFHNWAFMYKPEEAKAIWDKIPYSTHVLITHGPPYGILDLAYGSIHEPQGIHVGCPELLRAIEDMAPLFCVTGHVHESGGVLERNGTTFMNVAHLDEFHRPTRPAMVFEVG